MCQRLYTAPPSQEMHIAQAQKISKECCNFFNIGPNFKYNKSKCAQFPGERT